YESNFLNGAFPNLLRSGIWSLDALPTDGWLQMFLAANALAFSILWACNSREAFLWSWHSAPQRWPEPRNQRPVCVGLKAHRGARFGGVKTAGPTTTWPLRNSTSPLRLTIRNWKRSTTARYLYWEFWFR